MRHIHFITMFLALVSLTSCAIDELEYPVTGSDSPDAVTVIGHITRFADSNVSTKGAKNDAEDDINSMAIAIFPVKEDGKGLDGGCVYYEYVYQPTQLTFTLERGSKYLHNQRYALYVFANMAGLDDFEVGTELDDILDKTVSAVKNQNIPDDGFPMIGTLGDTFSTRIDQDGNTLILAPETADGNLGTPKVTYNGETSELQVLPISMKALFAKVNFSIKVDPHQVGGEDKDPPQFSIQGYRIVNVPSTVDFDKTTNASDYGVLDEIEVIRTGTAMGNTTIDFSFYLPENLLKPATDTSEYDYPFRGTYTIEEDKNNDGIRDQDVNLLQRYKGKLLGEGQKATNVVIKGLFRDHQGISHDVEYTIHLGKDSYRDFNVSRNVEYHNSITIRGIETSSEGLGATSIDHRVTVTRTQPAIISLRRELLLDSHFEIRPLRVSKSNVSDVGAINAVKVEVVNPSSTDWMRIERSFGNGSASGASSNVYITDANSSSYGKRKYFTTDLVKGTVGTNNSLVASTEVVVPIDDDGECVWIYVDECTEAGDAIRFGVIKVTYGTLSGSSFTPANDPNFPDVNYTISQRKLFTVNYDAGSPEGIIDYYIEYEEEYLYNFDAASDFGADNTEYEGMNWGLMNEEISSQFPSIFITDGSLSWLIDYFVDEDAGKYDFYLERDKPGGNSEVRDHRSGYTFCNEIIKSQNGEIGVLDLASKPESAVEYCYNKNKRNANGQVTEVKWYLPAIDEVEEIMKSQYIVEDQKFYTWSRFTDFQNKYYWSSMPAYERNYIDYDVTYIITAQASGWFYRDDVDRARATKVDYKGKVIVDGEEVDDFAIPESGVNTGKFSNTLYIREVQGIFNPTPIVDFTRTETRNTTGLYYEGEDPSFYQEGNKSRNDKARVRCVMKAEYAQKVNQ